MARRVFHHRLLLGAGERHRCERALVTWCRIETETEKGSQVIVAWSFDIE